MEQQSKEFLLDLLKTPSPSGSEENIQRKWISYVNDSVDKIETDTVGNAMGIINPDANFKVLIAGHSDEIGFMITRVDANGFLYFTKLGGISHKPAVGMKVNILGTYGTITGVIGANAEHHGGIKSDFGFDDLYIDCGAKTKDEVLKYVQIGDVAVYKRDPELLLNDRLSGRGLDNRTGAFIVAEVLKNVSNKNPKVGLYGVSTVNEETNMGGAHFAGARIEPNIGIATDVTFATDYPHINQNKYGEISLDNGPVLAKGAPINKKINHLLENAAKKLDMNVQYELTPRVTGTDADGIHLSGKGVPISLVSLPLRYMHAPVETVSLKDIEDEINLLTEFVISLTGEESVNPLD